MNDDATETETSSAYARLIEATLFAEAFNELLRPEETASFFLNIAHHFFSYRAGVVYPTGISRVPLAGRALDPQIEREITKRLTEEWMEKFSRELRPAEVGNPLEDGSTFLAVPLVFGADLLAYAVLVFAPGSSNLRDRDIVRVLGRAAGSALGRIYQSRQIEEERDYARAIFFSIVSAIINIDSHGIIFEANGSAQKILGSTIVGQHYRDLFGFTSIDPIRECLEKGIARQHVDVPAKTGIIWGLTASPLIIGERMAGAIVGFRNLSAD